MLSLLRRYQIARRREHATLAFEALEDRRLLAIVTVTSLADTGAGSLREAVALANAAPGPDTIDFDSSLTGGTIRLTSGEIVVTETLDVNGLGAELLTISGEDDSRILHGSSISGDVDLTIGDITLSGGRTTDERQPGGAVWLESSGFTSGTLTIQRSTILDNATEGYRSGGGALAALQVNIFDSLVTSNESFGRLSAGGAIRSNYAEITGSALTENATHGDSAAGGAIYSNFLEITGSTLSGNSTDGIFSDGGAVTGTGVYIEQSAISGNVTHGQWARGGGVYGYFVYAFYSTIASNRTEGDHAEGGGLRVYRGGIFSSTISGNSTHGALAHGGGIRNYEMFYARNSTITDNSTQGPDVAGGGLFTWGLAANETVIALNSVYGTPLSPDLWVTNLNLEFSLIGDNTNTGLSEAPVGMPDANGNLIGDPGGQGVIDPRLGPLEFNGGSTQTHAPRADSPVRDAGNPSAEAGLGNTPLFDQRGAPFSRVVGGRIDMGAFESPVDGDFNNDNIFDCLDIDELVLQIASGNNNSLFDMTGDGLVDLADRDAWLAEAGEVNIGAGRTYLLGDANLDGFVDGQDFILWNENRFTPVAAWCSGDFNADGFVDGADFVIWNENKFQGSDGWLLPGLRIRGSRGHDS